LRPATPTLLALCLGLSSCGGPRLPEQLTFNGQQLKKASEWKLEGVQSVVFIAEGESMRSAPLQVGVLTSTEHKTARELSVWLLRQYRAARVNRTHEEADDVTACKIGATEVPARSFVAVHLCRDREGFTACVEADDRLTPEMRFAAGDLATNWEAVCQVQWDTYRSQLEMLAERVIAQR
jgi:hypothetical protein